MVVLTKLVCDVYKSSKDEELYVYVKFGAGIESIPPELAQRLGKPARVMSLELTLEKKLARADVVKVMEQLAEKGYYLQLPPSRFNRGQT